MKDLFKGAALLIGGALVGAAVAMLLTPKTGEQVREQIRETAEDVKRRAQEYCEQVKQDLADANAAEGEQQPAPEQAKEA